jgi:hypothetical protein
MTDLVDGQIYRWRWTDAAREKFKGHDPYWCRSCIAIVRRGRLIDTYWSDGSLDHAVNAEDVELTFIGDEKWPRLRNGDELRYDRADICDTRHANHSGAPIYVRPGAQLNKAAMLAVLDDREADARSDIRSAEWRLEEIARKRALLEAGNLKEVYL